MEIACKEIKKRNNEFIRSYSFLANFISKPYEDYVFFIKLNKIKIYEYLFELSTIKLVNYVNSINRKVFLKNDYIDFKTLCNEIYKKDDETMNHCLNMSNIVLKFSKHMNYSLEQTNILLLCVCYHDVGKLIVPNSILFSKEKLHLSEWNIIKKHVSFSNINKLKLDKEILLCISQHHENIDGTGYPLGLKEDDISKKAQIVSIIDVYEALTSIRSYKEPKNKKYAIEFIKNNIGVKFNYEIANQFLEFIDVEEI